jgi:hypothetical protein
MLGENDNQSGRCSVKGESEIEERVDIPRSLG